MRQGERFIHSISSDEIKDLFYPDQRLLEAIRHELPPIEAEKEKACQEVQLVACYAFINLYGKYLSQEQIDYLRQPNVIIGSVDKVKEILKKLPFDIRDQNHDSVKLNGKLYRGYEFVESSRKPKEIGEDEEPVRGEQFWLGRLAVVGESDLEFGEIKTKHLKSWPNVEGLTPSEKRKAWGEYNQDSDIESRAVTQTFAELALHEKIHGCQNYDVPLPILEIAAYYYENRTFKKQRWEARYTDFDNSVKYWRQLIKEFGSDLHRFIFGNMKKEELEAFLPKLKAKFDPQKMKELFEPDVKWYTE